MPDENGYSLIGKVRAIEKKSANSPVPAVALTAFVGTDAQRKSLDAGFNLHLAKPIEGDQLLDALLTLLSR